MLRRRCLITGPFTDREEAVFHAGDFLTYKVYKYGNIIEKNYRRYNYGKRSNMEKCGHIG